MSTKLSYFMSIVIVLTLTGFVQAELIPIPDAGFDDQVLSAGGYAYIGDGAWDGELDYPGPWQSSGGDAWIDNGYYAADVDLPAVSGDNKLYGNDGVADQIYQILDATFIEGATYVLSVQTGIAWSGYDDAWSLYFTGEDPNTNIAEASGNATVGAWQEVSLVYTATADDAGAKIGIKLSGDNYVNFDDVTLLEVLPQVRELTDVGSLINGDFEYWSDHPDDTTWAYVSTIQDDPEVAWTASSSAWIDNGYAGYEHILGPNGDSATVISWGDYDSAVSQNLGITFVAGETYTFSIDIYGESAEVDTSGQGAGEHWCIGIGTAGSGDENASVLQKSALAIAASNAAVGPYYKTHPMAYTVLDPPDIFAGWQTRSVSYTATAEDEGNEISVFFSGGFLDVGSDLDTVFDNARLSHEVYVSTVEELEAAAAAAMPDDVINLAEGTYAITSQIEIKDGVTFRGAGPGLTIIDGNDLTRAFVAWGDPGATNGQVYVTGEALQNFTGPIEWALEDMTIQNCVADANNREDILSAARELLNDGGAPYTAETAADNAGAIASNPEWFDVLNADVQDANDVQDVNDIQDVNDVDEGLTAEELQAYLDNNLPGSEGHLVAYEGMNTGGGALILRNDAQGTVRNCVFLNNQAPLNSGDGGAINTSDSGTVLVIENSEFIGNSCDDGGGAIRLNGGSDCTITGTTFTGNQAIVNSGDGGAIMTSNTGTTLTVDNCEFNGNACIDGGGAIRLGGTQAIRTITGSTFTGNYIIGDTGDGGAIKIDGDDATYVLTNCSFIGNYAADDGAAINHNPDRAELTMLNCSFIGNGKDPNGTVMGDDGVFRVGDDDAGVVTLQNCLFADNAVNDDRLLELKAVYSMLNCTFIGNMVGDEALIGIRGRDWDSTGDGEDDATTDESIIDNCLFINNTLLSNKEIIGDTRNDVFAPIVTNCLFFGNLDQNGEPAINVDGNCQEVGTIDVSAVTDAAELVVDPAGDYHLVAGSAAIDASNPATATDADIEGTPAKGVRDVGAYESGE